MGMVNNETNRPSPRSQRAGRGPEDRRRRASSTASGDRSGRSERPLRGSEGFDQEAHGTRPGERGARRPAAGLSGSHPGSPSGKQRRVAAFWSIWGPHVRRFGPGILANHGVTLAVAVALAVILAIGTTFRAVPAYIGATWMLVNLSPVTISGAQLGVGPLLPALIILLVHSRRIRSSCGSTVTVRGIRTLAGLAIVIPAIITVIAWLMLWDASHVFDVAPPNIFRALLGTVVLHAVAVGWGLGPRIWRALLLRRGAPTWPVESVLLAGRFLTVVLLMGAAAAGVSLLVNHAAVGRAFDVAGGAGGLIGLTALSIIYFPNLAVGAASVLLGGEMHIGDGSVSLFAVTNTTLPPLPVLAVMPNHAVPGGPFFLLIPAVITVWTVYRWFAGRRYIESPLFTALGAGVCAGVAGLVLVWVAGGQLGYYGSAGPLLWLTPLLLFVWLIVPAAVVFGWVAWSGRQVTESAVVDEAEPEEEELEAAEPEEEVEQVEVEPEEPEDEEDEESKKDNKDAASEGSPEADSPGAEKFAKPDSDNPSGDTTT